METHQKSSSRSANYNLNFSIGLVISLFLVISAFEWKSYVPEGGPIDIIGKDDPYNREMTIVPVTDQKLEVPKPKQKVEDIIVEVVPVDDGKLVEEIKVDLPVALADEINTSSDGYSLEDEEVDVAPFVKWAEVMPKFEYQKKDFTAYVAKRFRVPSQARNNGVSGTVYIQFTVNLDGSLTDIEVLKGLGYGIDEEAIRILKSSPKWEPASQGGKLVRVNMMIPIKIDLSSN